MGRGFWGGIAVKHFTGSNTDGWFTTAILNLFLSPFQKNPIAADIIVFGIILGDFLFYIDLVCCMYSL